MGNVREDMGSESLLFEHQPVWLAWNACLSSRSRNIFSCGSGHNAGAMKYKCIITDEARLKTLQLISAQGHIKLRLLKHTADFLCQFFFLKSNIRARIIWASSKICYTDGADATQSEAAFSISLVASCHLIDHTSNKLWVHTCLLHQISSRTRQVMTQTFGCLECFVYQTSAYEVVTMKTCVKLLTSMHMSSSQSCRGNVKGFTCSVRKSEACNINVVHKTAAWITNMRL